jgi:lipoprotein-anchoring transpeptidase ErfK/SrfK
MIPEAAEQREVRISLSEHRLDVLEGGRVVWSATIGTGTGEVLEGAGQFWDFSTPPGRYRVQLKERDPVWILPDWYFVKRDQPIPPLQSPERRLEGALGAAALYLTEEIAIHGTDQPELLGDAISHGCIRMSNEDVLRLYEEIEVGTPVIVH